MAQTSKRLAILLGAVAAAASFAELPAASAAERTIYMAAIEPKGGTTVDKEPYPEADLPKGGGYVKKAPDPKTGRWEVSTYQFSPASVVVQQGDRVTLEVVGINGHEHSVTIDHYVNDPFVVKRGQVTRVQFVASKAGLFTIHCAEHEPAMKGTLLVLPKGSKAASAKGGAAKTR